MLGNKEPSQGQDWGHIWARTGREVTHYRTKFGFGAAGEGNFFLQICRPWHACSIVPLSAAAVLPEHVGW